MNKFIIGLVVLAVIIGGVFLFTRQGSAPTTPVPTEQTPTPGVTEASTTTPAATTFTAAQVAKHADATSCYTIIRSTVYDLTSWISQHPGGEGPILGICGKDGTSAFVNQHGGMSKQEAILATFKIGELAAASTP